MVSELHKEKLPFAFLHIARDEGVQYKREQVGLDQADHESSGGASVRCCANNVTQA